MNTSSLRSLTETGARVLITGGSGFIGTNLVEHYLKNGFEVLNADVATPRNAKHRDVWRRCDVSDAEQVKSLTAAFQPDLVLHMAARTDLSGATLDDYRANTVGVQNVIDASQNVATVRRVLFCSSMLVCRLGYIPSYDDDYCPDTLYGESKVYGERIVRDLRSPRFSWAILRPTSIWGPWFGVPYRSFFDAVVSGLYYHPRGVRVERTYGFVLNTIEQIVSVAASPTADIDRRTFYLGDYEELRVQEWADAISNHFRGKPVRTLPLWVFRIAAQLGDVAQRAGFKHAPMTSHRLKNMLTHARYNLATTQLVCKSLPYTMDEGVRMTLEWLANQERAATTQQASP